MAVEEAEAQQQPECTAEPEPASKWPDPVPSEWVEGRRQRAEEWFIQAREEALERHEEHKRRLETRALAEARRKAQSAWQKVDVQRYEAVQQESREQAHRLVEQTLVTSTMQRAPPEHVIRAPHYTALRPVVLVGSEAAAHSPFPEQLLIRGLAATLLAHLQPAENMDIQASGLQGFEHLVQPGCACTDLLWYEPMQPYAARDSPLLARLESLSACRVCVLVLTSSLLNSESWPAERDVISARILQQQAISRPFTLLVVSMSDHPLSAAPQLPSPPTPPTHTQGTRTAHVTVPCQASPQSQLQAALEALRPLLSECGLSLPPASHTHLFYQPSLAVSHALDRGTLTHTDSRIRNGLSLLTCEAYPGSHTATQCGSGMGLRAGALSGPLDTGPACVLAHGMPHPQGRHKPLVEWDVQDVRVWVEAQGSTVGRVAHTFTSYGVDGRLLATVQPSHLSQCLGLQGHPALPMLTEAIQRLQSRQGLGTSHTLPLSSTGPHTQTLAATPTTLTHSEGGDGGVCGVHTHTSPPVHMSASTLLVTGSEGLAAGADDPLCLTLSHTQLTQVFTDVFHYYDRDCTGDLSHTELRHMLAACGVDLSDAEVHHVFTEYDLNNTARLTLTETLCVLWDVWRLIIASRDVTTWNVPVAHAASLTQSKQQRGGAGAQGKGELGSTGLGWLVNARNASMAVHHRGGPKSHVTSVSGRDRESLSRALSSAASIASRSRKSNNTHTTTQGGGIAEAARAAVAAIDQELRSTRHAPPAARTARTLTIPQHADGAGEQSGTLTPKRGGNNMARGGAAPSRVSFAAHHPRNKERRASPDGSCSETSRRAAHTHKNNTAPGVSHPATTGPPSPSALTREALQTVCGGVSHPPSPGAGVGVCGVGSSHGLRSVSEGDTSLHANTVATDLDVFSDPALLSAPRLRPTSDPVELSHTLHTCLTSADLRRTGKLTPAQICRALATGMASDTALAGGGLGLTSALTTQHMNNTSNTSQLHRERSNVCTEDRGSHTEGSCGGVGVCGVGQSSAALSPLEMRLVLDQVLPSAAKHESVGPCGEIDIDMFVCVCVAAITESQCQLMDAVYTPTGSQRLLYRLHAQMYPHSVGYVEGLGEGAVQASEQAVASITSSALASTKVPFTEAPALLQVLICHLGLSVPLLVRAAVLQEAASAAERCAGSGTEVEAWSCTAAAMLYVFDKLRNMGTTTQ